MPEVNPKCFHQSASSIAAFKACPQRWRLAYREGLRLAEDTESQRIGTNWHAMHEVYANSLTGEYFQDFGASGEAVPQTPEEWKQHALEQVVVHLNQRYANIPVGAKTVQEWALERQILVTCFLGYLWYWQNDPVEFLHSELAFDLPVHAPLVGLPLPISEVLRVGKIDHVIKWQGGVGALERKSTTRSIASDSDYWDKSQKDTQVSMYALAFRDMLQSGTLPADLAVQVAFGPRFGNTLYDVWHRPTIKPAVLTQKATKELADTGKYMGQDFKIEVADRGEDPQNAPAHIYAVTVNGEEAEVEMGKKGFAIRETVEMFCARLLQDIYERPDFYFARREIARTDDQLTKFRIDLYNIYQTQKTMDKTGHFYENEAQCRATFPCSYIPICYGPGADAVCDGKTTPNGFKRIFVDLTINGREAEE